MLGQQFSRRVGFGLGVNDQASADPVSWASAQAAQVPPLFFKGKLPTTAEALKDRKNYLWSSDPGLLARGGAPFCETMPRTSPQAPHGVPGDSASGATPAPRPACQPNLRGRCCSRRYVRSLDLWSKPIVQGPVRSAASTSQRQCHARFSSRSSSLSDSGALRRSGGAIPPLRANTR